MAVPLTELNALLHACPECHRGHLMVAEKVSVAETPGLFRYTLYCTGRDCTFVGERLWQPPAAKG